MFTLFLNIVLVTTLSIYFLLDGGRISNWLLNRTPLSQRERIAFLMKTVDRAVGGYIRGTIVINALIGLLIGVGVFLLRVPYSFLLAVLAFFLSFIPVVGGSIIVAVSLLLALPEGWLTILLVAIFLILLQGVLVGQIIRPRVLGQAVGLHPIIAISALIVGGGLFGLLGALFAVPIAGIVQACLQALWSAWKVAHPEEFPAEKEMT
jgi:predicted PurR-regulated permease PerM